MADYRNIPVSPETKEKVDIAAGLRGMNLGSWVEFHASADLAKCNHKLTQVSIQRFGVAEDESSFVSGWYCPRCKKVYAEE